MSKRIMSLLFVALLLVSMAACQNQGGEGTVGDLIQKAGTAVEEEVRKAADELD